ncbi:hypothetical protein INR49_032069 [Caranx melampygus]|nr:hypothetical protein INR49_032069 [Caranx melampygus]
MRQVACVGLSVGEIDSGADRQASRQAGERSSNRRGGGGGGGEGRWCGGEGRGGEGGRILSEPVIEPIHRPPPPLSSLLLSPLLSLHLLLFGSATRCESQKFKKPAAERTTVHPLQSSDHELSG